VPGLLTNQILQVESGAAALCSGGRSDREVPAQAGGVSEGVGSVSTQATQATQGIVVVLVR
jgi:hypothetical protein